MAEQLYLECSAGISGDMLVAALLDAGADEAAVRAALDSLPVQGFTVRVSRVAKHGLDACDFDVVLDDAHENHDHDMAYLHGHAHGGEGACAHHGHDAGRTHGEGHTHGNSHHHGEGGRHGGAAGHHAHAHEHRNLADVLAIIDAGQMTDCARTLARRIFTIVAEAEAKAHGAPLDQVHFHEVGAVDSIADIVAIAVAFDSLGLRDVVVPVLTEGTGTIRCQHGIIPVPAPAVANIAQAHALPLSIKAVEGELVTPTGAAAAAALRTSGTLPERFTIKRVGLGAGKRDYATSGILRALVIEEA